HTPPERSSRACRGSWCSRTTRPTRWMGPDETSRLTLTSSAADFSSPKTVTSTHLSSLRDRQPGIGPIPRTSQPSTYPLSGGVTSKPRELKPLTMRSAVSSGEAGMGEAEARAEEAAEEDTEAD